MAKKTPRRIESAFVLKGELERRARLAESDRKRLFEKTNSPKKLLFLLTGVKSKRKVTVRKGQAGSILFVLDNPDYKKVHLKITGGKNVILPIGISAEIKTPYRFLREKVSFVDRNRGRGMIPTILVHEETHLKNSLEGEIKRNSTAKEAQRVIRNHLFGELTADVRGMKITKKRSGFFSKDHEN